MVNFHKFDGILTVNIAMTVPLFVDLLATYFQTAKQTSKHDIQDHQMTGHSSETKNDCEYIIISPYIFPAIVHRCRHLRSHPASCWHEGQQGHRSHQQRSRGTNLPGG